MYIQVCAAVLTVCLTCHWQVESTYVAIVVGIVTQCVHACMWLFAVLSTTGHLQQHYIAVCDCCDL